jgi:hypothetical protein
MRFTTFDSLFMEFDMSEYQNDIQAIATLKQRYGSAWDAINPESAARMRAQNRFKTGLDIARYTAAIMRRDMANYDADPSQYTQSLGCWHGFIGQQKLISIKKHFNSTDRRYLYLSGWMIAALRSEFVNWAACSASSMRPKAPPRPRSRTRSTTSSRTSYPSSPTSTPASATRKQRTCWPSR